MGLWKASAEYAKMHNVESDESDKEIVECPTTAGYNKFFKRPAGKAEKGKKAAKASSSTPAKSKTAKPVSVSSSTAAKSKKTAKPVSVSVSTPAKNKKTAKPVSVSELTPAKNTKKADLKKAIMMVADGDFNIPEVRRYSIIEHSSTDKSKSGWIAWETFAGKMGYDQAVELVRAREEQNER